MGDSLESHGTADALFAEVYAELRHLAAQYFRRQPARHTLQPTALVHEAYVRLARQAGAWRDREHFLAVAATAMRHVLTDAARRRAAAKRGGDAAHITLSGAANTPDAGDDVIDVLALDRVLGRLATLNPRHHRLVELRMFGGLTVDEAAKVLEVSARTVNTDWRFVKAWLRRELG